MSGKERRGATAGDLVTLLRDSLGLTQEQLGARLNTAARTVSSWETGEHMPGRAAAAAIDALCGWEPGTFAHAVRVGEIPPVRPPDDAAETPAYDPVLAAVLESLAAQSAVTAELARRLDAVERLLGARRPRRPAR